MELGAGGELETRLFAHLAAHGLLQRFSRIDEPARQSPAGGREATLDEQHAPRGVGENAIDGDERKRDRIRVAALTAGERAHHTSSPAAAPRAEGRGVTLAGAPSGGAIGAA